MWLHMDEQIKGMDIVLAVWLLADFKELPIYIYFFFLAQEDGEKGRQ